MERRSPDGPSPPEIPKISTPEGLNAASLRDCLVFNLSKIDGAEVSSQFVVVAG